MTNTCHIFCRVIDNFGDIGVTLRLARQLVAEHHFKVFLWVDDWQSLKRLSPALDLTAQTQDIDGVELNHWTAQSSWQNLSEPSLVIEAFGCELPADYLKKIAKQTGMSLEIIQKLNPSYRKGIIPPSADGNFIIIPIFGEELSIG